MNKPKTFIALLASFCLVSVTFAQKEKERIAYYVQQYKELAMAEMIRTGVPASITLAQGVLETGMGQSDLALNANNHFGIKCKAEWKGETIYHDDDEKGECFRKYPSVEDSYKDHSDFLRKRPNYASLFLLDITDYNGWAYGLKKAGYATNPTYPQRLLRIIEENNLHQYTLLALQQKQGMISDALATNNPVAAKEVKLIEHKPAPVKSNAVVEAIEASVEEAIVKKATTPEEVKTTNYPSGIFTINDTKVFFAGAGTSLLAIANNHKISYSKLLEFNELTGKRDILENDQLIFVEKKPKKCFKEVHIVAADETLEDIAQKEGIQLASMLELNHLQKGMKPAIGEKLFLKAKAVSLPKLADTSSRENIRSGR